MESIRNAWNHYWGPSAPETKENGIQQRAEWSNSVEFILACIGYAVGLGNVWRFPFLCYRSGGGAFLIPFIIMLIFIGLPLFYLELYIGQYTGLGPLEAFAAVSPFFCGVGYCTLIVISYVTIYYMVIVAWTLYYTLVSVSGHLDWGSCDNKFNTPHCYSGKYDNNCRVNNTGKDTDLTYYEKKCVSIGQICTLSGFQPLNGTHCWVNGNSTAIPWYKNVTRILASEEYYSQRVLGLADSSWEKWGAVQWHLVGCLFLSWLITFLCVIKGVRSAGKVVYFTSLFPYVMLTALVIRGVTLEGAKDGIIFYLSPDWASLRNPKVWGDAASQVFYSFGVANGCLITLASYSNFKNNCHFDAIFVSFANFGTSIYAGIAIFSVLGFQAKKMGVSVSDAATEGPGLAFVTYPEALLQMPIPALWAILFFSMLFILGLGCQFAPVETINTAIIDRWPHFRKSYWKVTAGTCTTFFALGLPMCFSGGVYLFTIVDWNTASWGILLLGMAESVAVAWSYGVNRCLNELADMGMKLKKVERWFWKACWKYIVPFGSLAILGFILSDWTSPKYEDYIFPWWADMIGWMIGLSTLVCFPIGVGWALHRGYRGKQLFTPTENWKGRDSGETTE